MYIASNIKTLRSRNGITQIAFAAMMAVEQSTVSNWEQGNRQPELEYIIKMADIFNVTIDDLIRKDMSPALPRRIKKLRDQMKLRQAELGEMVGVNAPAICKYESGDVDPSLDKLIALAKALNTSTDYLLGLTDERSPYDRFGE